MCRGGGGGFVRLSLLESGLHEAIVLWLIDAVSHSSLLTMQHMWVCWGTAVGLLLEKRKYLAMFHVEYLKLFLIHASMERHNIKIACKAFC